MIQKLQILTYFTLLQMHPKAKRLLGDTKHFCPVALKNHNVLHPCTDDIAARYRDRTFYFSSQEARDSFLQNPAHFVAHSEPLKVEKNTLEVKKIKSNFSYLLVFYPKASCPPNLHAGPQRIRKILSERRAFTAAWALPRSVHRDAPDDDRG